MTIGALIEENIVAVITALFAFVGAWAATRTKVSYLENRLIKLEELKLEVTLAEIKKDLKYIRERLDEQVKK